MKPPRDWPAEQARAAWWIAKMRAMLAQAQAKVKRAQRKLPL